MVTATEDKNGALSIHRSISSPFSSDTEEKHWFVAGYETETETETKPDPTNEYVSNWEGNLDFESVNHLENFEMSMSFAEAGAYPSA